MAGMVGRWRQIGRWTLTACSAVVCIWALQGCATNTSPAISDADAGLVTPSDEPESRRRARIRLELASNYFELGQTAVALDEVKQSLSADPSYADAFNLRGLIYMRLNDYPQAEDSFRRALSLRANDANILHNYGWLMCQQQKSSLLAVFILTHVLEAPFGTLTTKTR